MTPRTSKRVKRSPSKLLDLTLSSSDDDVVFQPSSARKATSKKVSPVKPKVVGKGGAEASGSASRGAGGKGKKLESVVEAEDEVKVASSSQSGSQSRRGARKGVAVVAKEPLPTVALDDKEDSDDPKVQLEAHQALFVGGIDCTCGAPLEVVKHKAKFASAGPMESFLALGIVKCTSCDKTVCRGCGEPASEEGRCCSAGRAVILYEVLSALDDSYLSDRLHRPVILSAAQQKAKSKGRQVKKGAAAGSIAYGSGPATHYQQTGGGGTGYSIAEGGQGGYYDDEDDMDEFGEFYDSEMDEEMAEMGYYNHIHAKPPPPKTPVAPIVPKDQAKDVAADKVFTTALTIISALLPHPDRDDANVYDFLPHPSLPSLLLISTFVDLLTDLLRNDSVADWTARSELYFAVLSTLEALGESESTLSVLCAERREKNWSEGLRSWINGKGDVSWDRKVVASVAKGKGSKKRKAEEEDLPLGAPILAPPLFSFLRRLAKQSEAFRKAVVTGDSFTAHDSKLIGLCGDITATGERCNARHQIWNEQQQRNGTDARSSVEVVATPAPAEATLTRSKGKEKDQAVDGPTYTFDDYSTACRNLSYDSVALSTDLEAGGVTFPTHHYAKDLVSTASAKRPHGGFVHLAKELAVLSTSLPSGIWLRVDEARIDAIKCMIAGPEGTPYAGGLFEFDIFVPMQYPNTPPHVWLKTTGNGACRFNPNLYAEGKVCLSILGTWPGSPDEMWTPTSTLLQVLISIQAMILGTSQPYFNEPGFGAARDNQPNKDYNANVSLATVRHAMLYWMMDDKKDGIWGDIIAMHFTLNRSTITKQITSWAAVDDRMRAWGARYNHYSGTANPRPTPAVLAGMPPMADTMDLVVKVQEEMDKVGKWRSEEFIKGLLV